jgi:hypothetical protein
VEIAAMTAEMIAAEVEIAVTTAVEVTVVMIAVVTIVVMTVAVTSIFLFGDRILSPGLEITWGFFIVEKELIPTKFRIFRKIM